MAKKIVVKITIIAIMVIVLGIAIHLVKINKAGKVEEYNFHPPANSSDWSMTRRINK